MQTAIWAYQCKRFSGASGGPNLALRAFLGLAAIGSTLYAAPLEADAILVVDTTALELDFARRLAKESPRNASLPGSARTLASASGDL